MYLYCSYYYCANVYYKAIDFIKYVHKNEHDLLYPKCKHLRERCLSKQGQLCVCHAHIYVIAQIKT